MWKEEPCWLRTCPVHSGLSYGQLWRCYWAVSFPFLFRAPCPCLGHLDSVNDCDNNDATHTYTQTHVHVHNIGTHMVSGNCQDGK